MTERSLLPKDLRGKIILITGEWGSGKSFFSASLDPNNTLYIDADYGKGQLISNQFPKMEYINLNESGESLHELGEKFLNLKDTEKGVIVIDNPFEIERGLTAYAAKNPLQVAREYSLIAANITSKNYGHDVLAQESLFKTVLTGLQGKGKCIVIISHLKDKWLMAGQKEIKGRKWLMESASLVLAFRATGGAPNAIALKQGFSYAVAIDPDNMTDDEFDKYIKGELDAVKIISRLPNKISSLTATKIRKCLSMSAEDLEKFPFDEFVSEDELMPYREILTKQQMLDIEAFIKSESEAKAEANAVIESMKQAELAELQTFIIQSDKDVSELIREAKVKFPSLAGDITPLFIIKTRQKE